MDTPPQKPMLPPRRPRPAAGLLGFLVLACGPLALAPELCAQSHSIRFETLDIEDGLSQNTVACILQDRTGFIWLGTQDGLNRYDGYSFTRYKRAPHDPSTLTHDTIQAMVEDPSGDLWIGTDGGGLNRWHRETDAFTHLRHDPNDPASLSGDRARALLIDRRGALWVGTLESGLNRVDPATGAIERFRHDPDDPGSLGDDRVRALYQDRLGNLWVATRRGLDVFRRATASFVHYRHDPGDPESLSHDRVVSLVEDARGDLWVGTFHGLNRLDRATGTNQRFHHDPSDPTSLSHDSVRSLLQDAGGRLWIGTDDGLNLWRPESGGFLRYQHEATDPTSLSSDRVLSMVQDRTEVLWIGTLSGGVNKWNPATWAFAHYRQGPASSGGLSSQDVYAISEGPQGKLWIGTYDGGLSSLDRAAGASEHYRHDPADPTSLSDDRVTALLHDRDGVLWVGTLTGGLNRLDRGGGGFTRFQHDPEHPTSLSENGVMSLFEDRRGELWIGTYAGGLDLFDRDGGTFRHWRHDPDDAASLGHDSITCIAETPDGALWIGTENGGLHRLAADAEARAAGTFQRFQYDPQDPESLSNDQVWSLHVDAEGSLWIGTHGDGLDRLERFDPATGKAAFRNYSERDGLPNDVIYGVHSDALGTLWLSTNNGLARLFPQNGQVDVYSKSHGLQSNEFNLGAHFQSTSGELFFGGLNGFNAFFPEHLELNTSVPPVVLTSFTKLNRPVDLERPIFTTTAVSLGHRDYFFSFEVAALDFAAPAENQYRYQLEGLDEKWFDIGHRRRVSFTNLDPGHYVLRVHASNNDGTWNREGLALPITIAPPPWRSGWAIVLYSLMLTALILAALRRKRRKERQAEDLRRAKEAAEAANRAKERFLANMSHEIRTPMNGVLGATSLLLARSVPERQRKYLETIRASGEALMTLVNDILDFSQIESGDLEIDRAPFDLRACLEEALDVTAPAAAHKGLDLGYWIEKDTPETLIGDAAHVRRVLINLLSNGVKFTDAGEVIVTVSARRRGEARCEIDFAVADSGIGIPTSEIDDVLEPFSQVDASTTRRHGGAGLGLAISRRLSELMGGRIWLESTEGEGSTCHFTLTAEALPERSCAYLYRPAPALTGKRLLLLDDNRAMRRLLGRYAEAWGMLAVAAGSDVEALDLLSSGTPFAGLLADWELLRQDGLKPARALGEACRSRGVPLMLLAALGSGASREGHEATRCHGVLTRPLRPEQLYSTLSRLIGGVRASGVRASGVRASGVRASGVRAAPTAQAAAKPQRILLVEDHEVNRDVAVQLLEHLGYRADTASHGLEALAAIEAQPYDIVLLDLQMPVMDGFETVRQLHRKVAQEDRPYVIAMTAYAMLGDREQCLAAGMDDYLSKPIQIEQLRAALQSAPTGVAAAALEAEPSRPTAGAGR